MRNKEDIFPPDYKRGVFRLFPTLLSESLGVTLPRKYDKWAIENADFAKETDIAIILILDALGAKQFKGDLLESLWKNKGRKRLSSVFPSSTSNALGSIFLGIPPEESGLTSVRFFVKEIGNFINSLKTAVLGKDEDSLPKSGVDPTSFLWKDSLIDKIADKVKIVRIMEKQYQGGLSRFFGRKGEVLLVGNEIDMFSTAIKGVREISAKNMKSLLFLYTPLLDTLGHSYGPGSREWRRGVNFINKEIKRFMTKLKQLAKEHKKKIGLFITADHGMAEINELVELRKDELGAIRHNQYIRGIMRSARTSFSYLTGKSVKIAKEKIKKVFKGRYTPYELEEVSDILWPCLDEKVERFKERVGPLVLLPEKNTEFRSNGEEGLFSDLGWGRVPFKGSHGGATQEEMEVPLIYSYFGTMGEGQ